MKRTPTQDGLIAIFFLSPTQLLRSLMKSNYRFSMTKLGRLMHQTFWWLDVEPENTHWLRQVDLKTVRWLTITPENFEEQFALIEEQEGELVFLAMTIPDYETMAYNMQELKRYITELKDVVVYYRKVTTEDISAKKTD